MLLVIPSWRVTITYERRDPVVLWVHDHHLSNVMRKVSDLSFSNPAKGFDEPISIEIGMERQPQQVGTTTAVD